MKEISSPLLSSPLLSSPRRVLQALMVLLVLAGSATAQTLRVLHVWVDPHSGVDTLPLDWNPGPAVLSGNRCSPTDTHPHNVSDGASPPNFLLHSPGPFKTVTAAINYVRSLHPSGLPHLNTTTGITTQQVVIHCLPGIYGPTTGLEPHTGLFFNGETFPILLPTRVSLQGTNAMNTVFIADGSRPVFEFGNALNAFADEPEIEDPDPTPRQFLANIAITGAIRQGGYASQPWNGAAIYFNRTRRTSLLVTNCFLYANAVGLLVDAVQGSVLQQTGQPYFPNTNHVVFLVNNTFAWNVCGIWNGQITVGAPPALPNSSLGLSLLCLANNLFDSSPPVVGSPAALEIPLPHPSGRSLMPGSSWERWQLALTGPIPGTTGRLIDPNRKTNFEGMDRDDVEAQVLTGTRTNYNAVELRRWNVSTILLAGGALQQSTIDQMTFLGLHQTGERNGRPANPSGAMNIEPLTGGGQGRGILFVRDLMHEGARGATLPFFVPTSGEFHDVCLGDFRLSPGALPAVPSAPSPGLPPDRVNPLIDQGFTFQNDAMGNPIPLTMWNSLTLTPDPFDLGNGEASFPHNPWDWDCEGFGNLRVFDHPIYPNAPNLGSAVHTTDIGADEVDLLIMAGYRQGTTTFMSLPNPPASSNKNNDYQWFLAASEGLTGATGTGLVPQTQASLSPLHSDYLPVAGWSPGPPASYYQPRYVDVVPHLLPDIHPWHSSAPHLFPTNVFWQPCSPYASFRNTFLYLDPMVGIVNPVGTWLDVFATVNNGNWLDSDLLAAAGSPSNPVSWMNENGANPPNTVGLKNDASVTGGWCFLADGTAPVTFLQPSANPRFASGDNAMRISCEFWPGTEPWNGLTNGRGTNLQTFMIWRQ